MSQDQALALTVRQRDQWLAVLDAYGVQFLVVDKQRDSVLLALVRSQPDWRIDSEDGEAALFTRVPVSETA